MSGTSPSIDPTFSEVDAAQLAEVNDQIVKLLLAYPKVSQKIDDCAGKIRKALWDMELEQRSLASKMELGAVSDEGKLASGKVFIQQLASIQFLSERIHEIVTERLQDLPRAVMRAEIRPGCYRDIFKQDIHCFAESGDGLGVYLSFPMLGVKVPPDVGQMLGKNHLPAFSRMYSSVLDEVFRQSILAKKAVDLSAFSPKTLTYIFVHPTKKRGAIIDPDNRDTRSVTNAVCRYLPGGDSAATTTFVLTDAMTDDVPEGTYLCISPGDHLKRSPQDILAVFRKRLENFEQIGGEKP